MSIGFKSKLVTVFILLSTSLMANDKNITIEDNIAGLYVAYFNRAPDKSGLDYWKGKGEEAISNGEDPSNVLNELSSGFASQPTFISTYGDMDNQEFVESIYGNILGKDGDTEGVEYWTEYIESGNSRSDMVADFVQASLSTDLTKENFPNLSDEELSTAQDRQNLISNKVEVSLNYTYKLGEDTNIEDSENPEDDPAYLTSIKILENVTEDYDTVEEAVKFLDDIKDFDDPIEAIVQAILDGNGMDDLDITEDIDMPDVTSDIDMEDINDEINIDNIIDDIDTDMDDVDNPDETEESATPEIVTDTGDIDTRPAPEPTTDNSNMNDLNSSEEIYMPEIITDTDDVNATPEPTPTPIIDDVNSSEEFYILDSNDMEDTNISIVDNNSTSDLNNTK